MLSIYRVLFQSPILLLVPFLLPLSFLLTDLLNELLPDSRCLGIELAMTDSSSKSLGGLIFLKDDTSLQSPWRLCESSPHPQLQRSNTFLKDHLSFYIPPWWPYMIIESPLWLRQTLLVHTSAFWIGLPSASSQPFRVNAFDTFAHNHWLPFILSFQKQSWALFHCLHQTHSW